MGKQVATCDSITEKIRRQSDEHEVTPIGRTVLDPIVPKWHTWRHVQI